MQGWQAFDLDLSGIGTWAMWDSSGLADPASGWNPFTGLHERDFGLLYQAPDGCGWPSRRLIAWRRGIEENQVMRNCAVPGLSAPIARSAAVDGSSRAIRGALEQVAGECR
jgi:hypothetical protein